MKRSTIDPTFIANPLAYIANGNHVSNIPDAAVVGSNRKVLAQELRSYGEDAVALAVEVASDEEVWAICKRSGKLMLTSDNIPRALCLAAVEIIEGRSRPLARRVRRRAT
jgi:hypothetical protein